MKQREPPESRELRQRKAQPRLVVQFAGEPADDGILYFVRRKAASAFLYGVRTLDIAITRCIGGTTVELRGQHADLATVIVEFDRDAYVAVDSAFAGLAQHYPGSNQPKQSI